jgi:hypothetical protein
MTLFRHKRQDTYVAQASVTHASVTHASVTHTSTCHPSLPPWRNSMTSMQPALPPQHDATQHMSTEPHPHGHDTLTLRHATLPPGQRERAGAKSLV